MFSAVENDSIGKVNTNSLNLADEFDLQEIEVGGTKKEIIKSDNGEKIEVSITKIDEPISATTKAWSVWHTRQKTPNGNYNVSVKARYNQAGFKISVKNNKITNAWDYWYWCFMVNAIKSATLTRPNDKTAILKLHFEIGFKGFIGGSWTGGVKAYMSGNKLITYID